MIAQDSDSLPASSTSRDSYFRFNYDNDLFSGTDRFYTQGTYFDLISPCVQVVPLKYLLPSLKQSVNYHGIAFEQDVFPPSTIRSDTVLAGDRPFSALVYLSQFRISVSKEKELRLSSKIDFGLIGPGAKGKETQQHIHRWTNNDQPLGWQYQVAEDYMLNYAVQLEKGLFIRNGFECIGTAAARAGTIYTDASASGLIRAGWMDNYFEHLGLSKKPKKFNRKFQYYVFCKGDVKAVGYNATLQGGMFNKTSMYILSSDKIQRIVYSGSYGFVFAFKRLSVEFTKVFITPEYYNGPDHSWGHCHVSVCF